MNIAKFAIPTCVLKDSFILAAGGAITGSPGSKQQYSNSVEIYDVSLNEWNFL
jgi:hypothetical protein